MKRLQWWAGSCTAQVPLHSRCTGLRSSQKGLWSQAETLARDNTARCLIPTESGVSRAHSYPLAWGLSEQSNLTFIPLCCTESWYCSQPGIIPSTPTCCPVTGRSNLKKKFGVTAQCWKNPYASPVVVSRRQTWIPLEICPDLKVSMEMGVIACTLCLWPNPPLPAVSRFFLTRVRL